ncbi:hypothetical protein ACFL34_00330 [Candidatus Sumerlaeota bacterium]
MAQFPSTEGDILILAQNIVAGLTANAATYPSPPVTAIDRAPRRRPLATPPMRATFSNSNWPTVAASLAKTTNGY